MPPLSFIINVTFHKGSIVPFLCWNFRKSPERNRPQAPGPGRLLLGRESRLEQE